MLPKKWYIQGSKQLEELSKELWNYQQNVGFNYTDQYFYDPSIDFMNWQWTKHISEIPLGYKKITFSQFEKMVRNPTASHDTKYLEKLLKRWNIR